MHGKSRVLSAIPFAIIDKISIWFLNSGGLYIFFSYEFYFTIVGPNGLHIMILFIVILCIRPNSCCQQNLECFDMPLLSAGLF